MNTKEWQVKAKKKAQWHIGPLLLAIAVFILLRFSYIVWWQT